MPAMFIYLIMFTSTLFNEMRIFSSFNLCSFSQWMISSNIIPEKLSCLLFSKLFPNSLNNYTQVPKSKVINIKSNDRSHKRVTMRIAIWVTLEIPRNLNYTSYLYLKKIKFRGDIFSLDFLVNFLPNFDIVCLTLIFGMVKIYYFAGSYFCDMWNLYLIWSWYEKKKSLQMFCKLIISIIIIPRYFHANYSSNSLKTRTIPFQNWNCSSN